MHTRIWRAAAFLLASGPGVLCKDRNWLPGGARVRLPANNHPHHDTLLATDGASSLRPSETLSLDAANPVAMVVGGVAVEDDLKARGLGWITAVVHYNKSEGFYEQFCGGSLVHPRLVLTAAHCVCKEFGFLATHVAIGRPTLSNESMGELIGVSAALVNPSWNMSTADGDVALLLLEHAANATPVAMLPPALAEALAAGQVVDALGWGAVTLGKVDTPSNTYGMDPGNVHAFGSDALEEALMDLISNQDCDAAYGGGILPQQLCTVTEKGQLASSCHGDSGGPLVATVHNTTFLVGVISFGDPNCTAATPNVYTRASSYYDWSESLMSMFDKGIQPKHNTTTPPQQPSTAPTAPSNRRRLRAA